MNRLRAALFFVLTLILASCTPAVERPAAPEIIYKAPANEVFPVVIRAISTSPGFPDSNGWIITESDRAGGFIRAQSITERLNLRNVYEPFQDFHTVSVVVSPNETGESTAVVTQFSERAGAVVMRIHEALEAAFGPPTQSGRLVPTL